MFESILIANRGEIACCIITTARRLGIRTGGRNHALVVDPLRAKGVALEAGGRLTAPMPAQIIGVLVHAGQAVKRGAVLVVLEAMKTQMQISCPADGVVSAVHYAIGDQVEEGATLVSFGTCAGG